MESGLDPLDRYDVQWSKCCREKHIPDNPIRLW